jgi:hypothetical protein
MGETTMPYQNSERKRQWEQDNRERRNAQRRERYAARINSRTQFMRAPVATPTPATDPTGGWKFILSCAIGALIFIGAVVGGASGYGDENVG